MFKMVTLKLLHRIPLIIFGGLCSVSIYFLASIFHWFSIVFSINILPKKLALLSLSFRLTSESPFSIDCTTNRSYSSFDSTRSNVHLHLCTIDIGRTHTNSVKWWINAGMCTGINSGNGWNHFIYTGTRYQMKVGTSKKAIGTSKQFVSSSVLFV